MKTRRFFFGSLLLPAFGLIAFSGSLQATTYYWDQNGATAGTGGTGAWDTTSSFWRATSDVGTLGTYGNATSDAVVLGGTAGTLTIATGGVNVNNLTFFTTGYTIAGGANALTLSGTAPTIDTGSGSQTITAAVAGTSGFTKLGNGTLTLSTTADTWTGNAIVSAGTLSVQIGQSATAGFILGNGTTLLTNQALATGNVISALSGTSTLTYSGIATASATYAGNGNLTISNGTTQINGFGTGGSAATSNTLANFGGNLTFGSNFTIRALSFSSGTGALYAPSTSFDFAGTTGAITSRNGTSNFILGGIAGTSTGANVGGNASGGTNNVFVGSANTTTSFAGFIANGSAVGTLFTKVGTGTLTLSGAQLNTGADAMNGGTLKLDYSVNSSGVLNAVSAANFGGGTLYLLGKNSGVTTQTMGNLQVNSGGGRLIVNPNGGTSTTLTLGTLNTGVVGGTLNIQSPDVTLGSGTAAIKTTSVLTTTGTSAATSIYSTRFTYGSDWLTGGTSSLSTLAAYSSYADLTTGIAAVTNVTNDRLNNVGNATLGGNFTTNSLKITNSTSQSLDVATFNLALTTGSLLFTGSADYAIGTTVNNGTFKPTGTELILHQLGTGNLTINSVIANGSAASALTKAGFGTLTLTGTNTYSGVTYLNGGTVSISSNANVGAVATGAAVNFNGGTLQATGTFALDNGGANKRAVNIGGGGGTVDVTGSNVFTISGTVNNTVANQFGPLVKTGTGTLILSDGNANSTYSGATIISGGILSTPVLANGGTTSGIGNSVATAPMLVLDGGTLQYTGGAQSTDRTFTLTNNGGALDASGSGALNFSSTLAGAYTGSGNRTLTLTGSNAGNNILATPLGDASTTTGSSGIVSVAKTGAGKWVLSNANNTYTGNTTISGAGTLVLGGASTNSISFSPVITVGTGSTLDVTGLTGGTLALTGTQTLKGAGTISGGITTASGSIVTPGSSVGTLTMGSLTLSAGSIFNFEFNTSPANDLISVTGSNGLALNGGGLNLYIENTLAKWTTAGTYNLFQYSGTIGGAGLDSSWTTVSGSNSHILNPQSGLTYGFGTSGSFVTLTIGGTPSLIGKWNVDASGNWSAAANWDSNPNVPGAAGDTANFTTALSAPRSVTLDGSRTVGTVNFDSASPNGYTIAAGGGTLTLDNSGVAAVLSNVAGSHTIGAPVSLNSNVIATVVSASDILSITGDISNAAGSPTLTKSGLGTLALSGNNTYGAASGTVGTTLAAGTLRAGSNTAFGAGDVAVSANSTLQAGAAGLSLANNIIGTAGVTTTVDTQANTFTLAGILSQTGASAALTKIGAGTLVLSGTNTYTGATTVSNGILQLGNAGAGGSVAGNIVNNAALTLNRTDDYTLGNTISGTGTLTQSGADNITLSAANTFSGDTVIAAGTVITGVAGALQNSTVDYNNQGGSLSFGTLTAATLGGLKGAQNLVLRNLADTAGVALTVGGNVQSTAYSGALSGTGGSLTKSAGGTLTLTGANSYTGNTQVNGGLVILGTGGVINGAAVNASGGNVQVNGGTLTSSASSAVNQGQNFTLTTGSATFNAGIKTASSGGDGALIRVDGGTFTATTVTLLRTTNYAAPNLTTFIPPTISQGAGFVVTGGTVSVGTLSLGDNVTNSSMSAYFGGGDTTITNQIVLGQEQNNRWNYLQVAGGTLTAADNTAAGGIVIGKAGSSINSELYLTGGTTTLGRIAYGASTDAVGGTAVMVVNGGTLYVGAGGILNANTAGLVTNTILTAGTMGAAADWSSTLAMQLNGSNFTIKAADAANAAHDISLGGVLSGPGSLTKTGGGTLTVTGANTFSGATVVNNGTLYANTTNGALNTGLSYTSAITINSGGTLQSSSNSLFGWDGSQIKNITVNTGGILTADNGADVRVGRVTLAGGSLQSVGSSVAYGSWVFDGASGVLAATDNSTVSAVNVRMQNGASVDVSPTKTLSFTGTITDTTNAGNSTLIKTGTGTLILGNTNTYTGGTTVTAGTLALGHATDTLADAGAVTVNGGTLAIDTNSDTVGAVTLTSGSITGSTGILTGSSYATTNGTINAILGGTGAFTQAGSGTTTLNGTNTYTGATTINTGGTLALGSTGSIANSTVVTANGTLDVSAQSGLTIGATQTLKGSGTVNVGSGGNLAIAGTLAAGNSPGVLAVSNGSGGTGSTSFSSGSIFSWDLDTTLSGRGTAYDGVNTSAVSGTDAIFQVVLQGAESFSDAFWTTTHTWSDIFTTDGSTPVSSDLAAVFSTFTYANGSGALATPSSIGSFTLTGSTLSWSAVPEPTSALAGLLLGAGLLRRRRSPVTAGANNR